jgi:hypothetical protein
MIMKTRRTIKVASSVSKQIISLLYALLFTGCMDDDFVTSDKDIPPYYHVKVEEKFRQEPVHSPRQHEQYSVFPDQTPDYRTRSCTNDWQHSQSGVDRMPDYRTHSRTNGWQHSKSGVDRMPDYRTHSRTNDWQRSQSGVGTKSRQSASPTQTIIKKPSEMPADILEQGCSICYDEDAYKTQGAVQCSHCTGFVCQPCYRSLGVASEMPIVFDYHAPMSTGDYRLRRGCPFCRGSF